MSEVNRILIEAKTAPDVLQGLYALRKTQHAKYSLAYFCRQTGIQSKGFLSDVIKGRKAASEAYWPKLAQAFGLEGPAAEALMLLLELQAGPEPGRASAIARELASLKKLLRIEGKSMTRALRDSLLPLDVFAAFGLYRDMPTRKELQEYFGRKHAVELEMALQHLLGLGAIAIVGDHFEIVHTQVRLFGTAGEVLPADIARMGAEEAARRCRVWFEQKDDAFITSIVASVNRDRYQDVLPRIKKAVYQAVSDLESSEADMLVRFNVMIYPVDP
jgi:hypothetical protein